jgi:hypothetical protein
MALDSITQMPNLPITSAFKASLPAAPKGRIGPKEIAPAAEELSSAISTASQKVGEADVNIKKAEREEQAIGFEKRAEGKRKFVEDIETMPERQAYKEAVKQERGMEFVPTRDTVQDIAGLFGLLGVVGMVIGKGNAMQAMGAMNGMMEGHRKGRQDLYKQELQQFEKNFKAMQAKVSAALADLQEALKVKQYDNEAGDLEIQAVLARSESPFLKAVKDKQGDAAVLERLKEVNKSVTVDMPNTINTLQEKADAATAAERRFRETMEQRQRLARLQREGGGGGGGKGGGAANARYAFNINESFSQAATDLLNVSQMPKNTVLGTFAGMTGQSGNTLLSSLENVAARAVTSEDSRLMQQIVAGLDQNMARALGGGYASSTSKGLIQAYKEQVAQVGDSALAQAMFLSRMKQELGVLAKAFKNHPGSNEGYVRDMQDYMDDLNKAIPFNVSDVIAANRGKKQTVTEKFSKLAQTPAVVPLPSREGLVTQKAPSAPVAAPTTKYDSAETVKNDYRNGKISKEQATSILVDQFGYKP